MRVSAQPGFTGLLDSGGLSLAGRWLKPIDDKPRERGCGNGSVVPEEPGLKTGPNRLSRVNPARSRQRALPALSANLSALLTVLAENEEAAS
jgi:hypothetical protein